MRPSMTALLLGAASTAAALQDQKVLSRPSHHSDSHSSSSSSSQSKTTLDRLFSDFDDWTKSLRKTYGDISSEAKATWEEIAMIAPDAVETLRKQMSPKTPKKSQRKSDKHWDYIVKGGDLENVRIQGEDGKSRPKVDGRLDNYSLRARHVDTSKLGVDTVKQFSGYLDDNEEDKHLFYCKLPYCNCLCQCPVTN